MTGCGPEVQVFAIPLQAARQRAFRATVSVCQPTADRGPGARDHLPHDCFASDQEGRVDSQNGTHRCRHAAPVLRQRAQCEGSFPDAFPGGLIDDPSGCLHGCPG
jgi:hypothetical protein